MGFRLVEMDISTNPKPTLYRNLYKNTGPEMPLYAHYWEQEYIISFYIFLLIGNMSLFLFRYYNGM